MTIRTPLKSLMRILGWAVIGALLLTAGCASKAKTVAGPKVAPSEIKVYESTEVLHSQYTLVQHLWVDSCRSAWTFPRFSSEAEGLEAMKRAASDAGANALLHTTCVDAASKPGQHGSTLYCYGDAIRVN